MDGSSHEGTPESLRCWLSCHEHGVPGELPEIAKQFGQEGAKENWRCEGILRDAGWGYFD
jgi:hypothetical protein